MSINIEKIDLDKSTNLQVEIAGCKFQWLDVDYLEMIDNYGNKRKICGGDFQSLISALCSVEVVAQPED